MMTKERFEHLAKTYTDSAFRLAFSRLKNRADAHDVTQETLLKLWKTDKRFESDDHAKNWLMRVTMNECRKHWRSPWSRRESFDEFARDMVFEQEQSRDLFYAIMALEDKYRTVIVLYYYEGYSISEIARLLGLPAGTVGTRLRRAREQLKHYLTEDETV